MDVSIWVEAWREGIKVGMRKEPMFKKVIVAAGGALTMIMCLIVGSYMGSYWSNVASIQKMPALNETYFDTDYEKSVFYDIMFVNGTYIDEDQAQELKIKINETCDWTCQQNGCRWSVIYIFAACTLIIMGVNGVLLVLGGWIYTARMTGIFCHHFLTVFNIASLIVTHQYRNRDQGKLAALSVMPSKYVDPDTFDVDWTYQDDANFIDKIWVWQLLLLFVTLITTNIGCLKVCNRNDVRDSQVRLTMTQSMEQGALIQKNQTD